MTPYFKDNGMALDRMARDIQIMRDYFESLASSSMPALSRVIEQEIILSLLWQRCFMSHEKWSFSKFHWLRTYHTRNAQTPLRLFFSAKKDFYHAKTQF